MSDLVFVDTNVLVYARDLSEKKKQPRASAWMASLWQSRRGRVSAQVLQEFYVTVTQTLRPGLEPKTARADVRSLFSWTPVLPDIALFERAWSLKDRDDLSWWDALVVGAAEVSECSIILSEDLGHGRRFGSIEVIDPFQADPPATDSRRLG